MPAPVTAASSSNALPRKRWLPLAYLVAAAGAVLAFASALAPWVLSNAALRSEMAVQVHKLTGLTATPQGEAAFIVLPRPHISVEGVTLADSSGGVHIDAKSLKCYVRLAPLLTGRIEIASVILGQPEITISADALDLDPRTASLDTVLGRAASAPAGTPEADASNLVRLGSLTLVDGRALLTSAKLSSPLTIDAINAALDWQKPGGPLIVSGKASFGGETTGIALWIANPAALLRGQRSAASLKAEASSFSLAADGTLAATPRWQFNGRLHAAAASLKSALGLAGYPSEAPLAFNGFEASCSASIEREHVICSSLRVRFDGNDLEGALALQSRAGVPLLSGALSASELSLRPLLSSLPPAVRDGQWSRAPFDLHQFPLADLDLRVSSGHLLFSHFALDDAAFSLLRTGSLAELTLAGAKAYQGTLKGRLTLSLHNDSLTARASGVISGADLAGLTYDALGWPEFYGSLTGSFEIESSGSSLREVMHSLAGTAHAGALQGQLDGLDLESALRRIDKSPLALLSAIRHGRTAFERASFGLRLANGVASIEDGKLENPALRLALGGTMDFGERTLDLHAVAVPLAALKAGKEATDFRFDFGGSWDDLSFSTDVRGLIRRSGAAAPLFPQRPPAAANFSQDKAPPEREPE